MSAIIAPVGWDSAFVYSVLCSFVFDFSTYEKFFEHFGGNALSKGVWVCVKVGHGGFLCISFRCVWFRRGAGRRTGVVGSTGRRGCGMVKRPVHVKPDLRGFPGPTLPVYKRGPVRACMALFCASGGVLCLAPSVSLLRSLCGGKARCHLRLVRWWCVFPQFLGIPRSVVVGGLVPLPAFPFSGIPRSFRLVLATLCSA